MLQNDQEIPCNPLDPDGSLKAPSTEPSLHEISHPPQLPQVEDSAVTKAEKFERHGLLAGDDVTELPPSKRVKLDSDHSFNSGHGPTTSERQKGIAPIKAEYLVHPPGSRQDRSSTVVDDDAAEASIHVDKDSQSGGRGGKKKEKSKGQNTSRHFGSSNDEKGLCQTRAAFPEFSPAECRFGSACKYEHDLKKYLRDWKREDLTTFGGVCPIWSLKGKCDAGWKCRFVGSHMDERDLGDGRKELILVENEKFGEEPKSDATNETGVVNLVSTQDKIDLTKRRMKTPKADLYSDWLEKSTREMEKRHNQKRQKGEVEGGASDEDVASDKAPIEELRAQFTEPPFLPSEKRRIYFGPETPVLAPLTTQGNLPFRRLCVGLGAQLTYSEMAMSVPLLQGQKSEWALMKAHESETRPPRYLPGNSGLTDYDNFRDLKFGAQIAANKPWQALKATEILSRLCPHLRVIDVNCGCPIDLVYRQGAGSALLDNPAKLEKMIRGMNAVSGEIPVTVKIRMGTRDSKPTAQKLVDRLVYGGFESLQAGGGSSGVAAITLHGRSRQQRYTRNADWGYISDCAALINRFNEKSSNAADTVREGDSRYHPAGGRVFFIGNGDCYSHVDYNARLQDAKVDAVMIARGALIKPWIFEEIEQGQYLDKSATERLSMIEQYVRYGLETWGSDEMGVGTTRRFLLEWLSFAYRYVPVGIMEHLPPSLQDRPPAWRGRNDLETLLGSDNYKDWIKISEMFLGPAHKDFRFEPKHKSNSYEIEAEG